VVEAETGHSVAAYLTSVEIDDVGFEAFVLE
jgi:hypothetical protein